MSVNTSAPSRSVPRGSSVDGAMMRDAGAERVEQR